MLKVGGDDETPDTRPSNTWPIVVPNRSTMGNLTPISLWSRTEYESRGLGASFGSFNPKQSNEGGVAKIESFMSAKIGRLLQSAKANFLRDSSGIKDPESSSWGAAVF